MNPRRIDDEEFGRTYFVEPVYSDLENDPDNERRSLIDMRVVAAEVESADGSIDWLGAEQAAVYTGRVWEMLRQDEALLERLERPSSIFEEQEETTSHLQRMRELRKRLRIRRNLNQDVG